LTSCLVGKVIAALTIGGPRSLAKGRAETRDKINSDSWGQDHTEGKVHD
jgi:hypothetical protein